ncbi:Kruppel like factor 7 [Phyllostomus discolor]|uniref:Kruppel like factor 7 n=1 Tax=Phyllostomus discolor TaxID=89673 RepID=A0A834AMQ0_9CHIR|nr:Kruppel like factor 7 [Phyllostomus discolor]
MHKMKSRGCHRNQLYGNLKDKVPCKGHTCPDLHFQRISLTHGGGAGWRGRGWTQRDRSPCSRVRSLISARGKGVSGVLHEAMSSRGTTGNTQVQSPLNATTATGVFPGLTILPSI